MPIRLTSRCLSTFRLIGNYGYLTTKHVHDRMFSSVTLRRCQQKLQDWADGGYIHTTRPAAFYEDEYQNDSAVHSLTKQGASAVRTHFGTDDFSLRAPNSKPAAATLAHRVAVVEAALTLDDACRLHGLELPDWIMEYDNRDDLPADTKLPPHHRSILYHSLPVGSKCYSCRPDAACVLTIPPAADQRTARPTDIAILWEIDRSTEGLAQIKRKLYPGGYTALFEQRAYRRYWPDGQLCDPLFRVFWVVPSYERVESITDAIREYEVAKRFRFLVRLHQTPEQVLTEEVWYAIDVNGGIKRMSIYQP